MIKAIFFGSFLFAILLANAQSNSKEEGEIRRLEQLEVTSILKGDTNSLKQVWAPDFMVNNPRNEISRDREAVLQAQRSGIINYSSFERVLEQIQFQGEVVITMGHETFIPKNDIPGARAGQTYKRRFTNIWMKKAGSWQQVARHASVICQ